MKKNLKSRDISRGGQCISLGSDRDGRVPDPLRTGHDLHAPLLLLGRIFETWKLGTREQAILLGLDESDQLLVQDVLSGTSTIIGRDFRERIAYLIQIRRTLFALFRDDDVENEWLHETHELLGNHAPMDLLLEGSMANLLLVKEYCDEAAGL